MLRIKKRDIKKALKVGAIMMKTILKFEIRANNHIA